MTSHLTGIRAMLLFSTLLDVSPSLTRETFLRLIAEWNEHSRYNTSIIRGLKESLEQWDGERPASFGDDTSWLEIQEYRNRSIMASRYGYMYDGAVWCLDYVMNFSERKISVQLDRTYRDDALYADAKFSTPYFITLLAERGFLEDDGELPTTKHPFFIDESNAAVLGGIITGKKSYRLPIVYISKKQDRSDPVNVKELAHHLKGAAHVLVQKDLKLNSTIRKICADRNEYNGAAGIYFPAPAHQHRRFFYRTFSGFDRQMFGNIVRTVISYAATREIDPLYTWQGVDRALLRDRWASRGRDIKSLKNERDEANKLVDSTDAEIKHMQSRIDSLTRDNERLIAENAGLRRKVSSIDSVPVIFHGNEEEFYPDEIKDILLSVLDEAAKGLKASRRRDILRDIVQSNGYRRIQKKRAEELKAKLKGESRVDASLQSFLEEWGFRFERESTHYRLIYYGDERYSTTLSKTGSDRKAGSNAAAEIIKQML